MTKSDDDGVAREFLSVRQIKNGFMVWVENNQHHPLINFDRMWIAPNVNVLQTVLVTALQDIGAVPPPQSSMKKRRKKRVATTAAAES